VGPAVSVTVLLSGAGAGGDPAGPGTAGGTDPGGVVPAPESMGSTTKYTAAPSRARTRIPARIMVCCGRGGFGSVSSGGMVLLSTASARDQVAAMAATLATSAGVSFTGGSAGDWASRGEVVSGAGETGAATGAATTGIVTGGAAAGLTGAPQDSQNLAFAPSAAPHCRQAGRASIFAPHDSQNFIPGVTGLPHFRQVWGFAVMYMHHTDSARSSVLILVVLC